jgi:preprotein translocase subunit SecD
VPPTTSASHPGRLLAIALALVVVLYGVMFATGATKPQLGLDLRGGTQVTLKPKVQPGVHQKITKDNLDVARDIIDKRVNAFGVAEATVVVEGSNIVISVPGKGRNVVDKVGQTALLDFRQPIQEGVGIPAPLPSGSPTPTPTPTPTATTPSPTPPPGPAPTATSTETANPPVSAKSSPRPSAHTTPATHGRALSAALMKAKKPHATKQPTAKHPRSSATPTPTATPSAAPAKIKPGTELKTLAQAQAVYANFQCGQQQNLVDGVDDYLVSCDADPTNPAAPTKYLLDKVAVPGTEIKSASAGLPQNALGNDWQVQLSFKGKGASEFGTVTTNASKAYTANPNDPRGQVAIILDHSVISSPRIDQGAILGGNAQITGGFTETEAKDLANNLKFGALPISFVTQDAVTVSATLGSDQLHYGLLAGAIGLILVVIYSLVFYRGLGLVTIASLGLAGAYTYAAVCLLGKTISYTLTLAGIAGLIVAIGITADSFVVYFERLRDEVREGRTLRTSVERGWARAVRTIVTADFVSFLAAAVLYLLSIGSVRGFAFTLGLSTIIDLVVVFLFTKPMITLLVRTRAFGSGRPWTGLGGAQLGVAAPAVAVPTRVERPHRARR